MQNDLNLREFLKGHENEVFYSPVFGDMTYLGVDITEDEYVLEFSDTDGIVYFREDGKLTLNGECVLFPSKEQRDWNKWVEEQKPKVPKTWSDLCLSAQVEQMEVSTDVIFYDDNKMVDKSYAVGANIKIAKSALALLKIYQLIEVGYGGNITKEEWNNDSIPKFIIYYAKNQLKNDKVYMRIITFIAFHTQQQRDEFLSHPENVQLVKDYYMME